MSATPKTESVSFIESFIPLNGASCLQLLSVAKPTFEHGFIPLNGASCLQPSENVLEMTEQFHSPKRGVMSATLPKPILLLGMGFIPLNGASCLQP